MIHSSVISGAGTNIPVEEPNPLLSPIVTTDNEGTLRFYRCDHKKRLNLLVTVSGTESAIVATVLDRFQMQKWIHEAVAAGRVSQPTHDTLCFALTYYRYNRNRWEWGTRSREVVCHFSIGSTAEEGMVASIAGFWESAQVGSIDRCVLS